MSLVIKSDKSITYKKLKDVVSGAVVSLDFRDSEYLKNDQPLPLSNFIEINNASEVLGGYHDVDGNYYTASNMSAARLTINPRTFDKGLLIESTFYNYYRNGGVTPVSRAQDITLGANLAAVVSIKGSGKMKLTVDGKYLGEVTEANYIVFYTDDYRAYNIVTEIIGTVTFASISTFDHSRLPETQIAAGLTPLARLADRVQIKPQMLSELLPDMTGTIVIKQRVPLSKIDRSKTVGRFYSVLQVKTKGTSKGFVVARGENMNATTALRAFTDREQIIYDSNMSVNTNTYALSFSRTGATLALNGEVIGTVDVNSVDIDSIFIGSSETGSGSEWARDATNIIEQVLLYSRELTSSELEKVTGA